MNYLAHFHLSHGDDELLLGALLGDFVKGPLKGEFSAGIERGIWLHRKIDSFTDTHPDLKILQQGFDRRFRRYGGIMLDVAFDHFLNRHWQQFHPLPLSLFSTEVYRLLNRQAGLHAGAQAQAKRLVRYDVFGSYQHWTTVEAALMSISQRLGRDNPLPMAAAELQTHYAALERQFLDFYPDLIAYCERLKTTELKTSRELPE